MKGTFNLKRLQLERGRMIEADNGIAIYFAFYTKRRFYAYYGIFDKPLSSNLRIDRS